MAVGKSFPSTVDTVHPKSQETGGDVVVVPLINFLFSTGPSQLDGPRSGQDTAYGENTLPGSSMDHI
jgi:hypothetical protein